VAPEKLCSPRVSAANKAWRIEQSVWLQKSNINYLTLGPVRLAFYHLIRQWLAQLDNPAGCGMVLISQEF